MIKSFSQYIGEDLQRSSDHKVIAFGRVNPVTPGHVKLFNFVRGLAAKNKADHEVVLSHSQDAKKNPLSPEQKLQHAQAASPQTNISVADTEHPTLLHQLARAHQQGYRHITVVAGADRVPEFQKLLNTYKGVEGKHGFYDPKTLNVVSAGHRDPDAEGVEGMSASKMRDHAINDRKKDFLAGVPHGVNGEEMYKHVRQGMGLK